MALQTGGSIDLAVEQDSFRQDEAPDGVAERATGSQNKEITAKSSIIDGQVKEPPSCMEIMTDS